MSDETLNVKIVRLEPMRVACVNGYGEGPEGIAFEKMNTYIQEKGLDRDGKQHRVFGFNNPDPAPGSPNYGYDVWITVDESCQERGRCQGLRLPRRAVRRVEYPPGDRRRDFPRLAAVGRLARAQPLPPGPPPVDGRAHRRYQTLFPRHHPGSVPAHRRVRKKLPSILLP